MLQDKIRQLAFEKQGERLGRRHFVFTASRHITADKAKHVDALLRAEIAGDFLLQLGHADVVLALTVDESHRCMGQEPEGFGLVIQQPLEQASRFAAFRLPRRLGVELGSCSRHSLSACCIASIDRP